MDKRIPARYWVLVFVSLLVALVVGQLAVCSTANASKGARAEAYTENSPGCISHREWLYFQRGTQSQVESRYGVTGLGKVVVWQNGGDHVVRQYPWCNHPYPIDFIQVAYDKNVRGQYMSNYVTEFDFNRA